MKKVLMLLFIFCLALRASSQLVVVLQSPPSGITYKPQLWNMVLSNTTSGSMTLHVEVTLTPVNSSSPILSGATRVFSIAPGTTMINANILTPIQYNVISSSYPMDANPVGLLPIGHFEACYHFFKHITDNIQEVTEQCQDITIGPLSPPQLVYPYDQTSIQENNPQFTWLPPVPTSLFSNLLYDFNLVEINAGQSAADAVEQNIPLYQGLNITSNTLLYPLSATALEYEKHYAWRITAKNNDAVVGTSDTWEFSLKHFEGLQNKSSTEQSYAETKKDPETAYAVFVGEIKFSYLNEVSDSLWKVKVFDLSSNRDEGAIPLDTVPLKQGQNLVTYNAMQNSFFVDKHLYQLEIINSRNEIWRLRFEYRKPENNQ